MISFHFFIYFTHIYRERESIHSPYTRPNTLIHNIFIFFSPFYFSILLLLLFSIHINLYKNTKIHTKKILIYICLLFVFVYLSHKYIYYYCYRFFCLFVNFVNVWNIIPINERVCVCKCVNKLSLSEMNGAQTWTWFCWLLSLGNEWMLCYDDDDDDDERVC